MLNHQISTLEKKFISVCEGRVFFLFVTWYVLFTKKKIHYKMQRESSTISRQQFILIMSSFFSIKIPNSLDYFRSVENWSLRILYILKKKDTTNISFVNADCRAFHAATSGIFCYFLINLSRSQYMRCYSRNRDDRLQQSIRLRGVNFDAWF